MVRKTFFKSTLKTFTENISRFLVICFVVMLGIAFVSGLGTLSSSLTRSINNYYKNNNGADLIIKTKSETGFTLDEIKKIEDTNKVVGVRPITSIDNDNERVIISDFNNNSLNKLSITSGEKITGPNEILVDRVSKAKIGDTVKVLGSNFKVVGVVSNPSYYVMEPEQSIHNKDLDNIYYLDSNYYDNQVKYLVTDLYVKLDVPFDIFSNKYKNEVKKVVSNIESENSNFVVLPLDKNLSFALTKSYGEKIDVIASIFPLFFIVVSVLVVYSTITRLISEEREIIGCYRSLGISKGVVVIKYFVFTFLSVFIGALLGFFIGINLIPSVVYPAFDAMFFMPDMTGYRDIMSGIITGLAMLIILCFITILSVISLMKGVSADLLKPKAPKAGKKILMEKIPFLWKRLSFKYKSSFRNIFRYKVNLFMTIISVAGSTALTFAGFGLFAIAISPNTDKIPISMADSFALISLVIISFAAILCILVIFNITNMNIQERKREIATLRVLGYQQNEVSGYIYREINITTLMGIIIGIPLGYIFLNFLFEFLEFGNIKDVNFYYYLLTIVMIIVFVLLAEFLLKRKIRKVDMNGSLKSNE